MSWQSTSAKSDRRLYVDMLFHKTNMYAHYLPASYLELGDYGVVTRAGEFIKSGNILKDHPSLKDELGLLGKETMGSNKHFFASRARSKDAACIIEAEISDLAECSLKLGWDIKKDRHAVLVMIDANHHEIEFEGRLHKFLQNKSELADKAVVTKVYRCSAYAQIVTECGRSGRIYVGLKANSNSVPSGTTPTMMSSGSAEVHHMWKTFSQTGNWCTGNYHPSPPYTPLATLRQIRPKEPTSGFRDLIPPAISDDEEMDNYIPSWGELDEEGNEIDPEDLEA